MPDFHAKMKDRLRTEAQGADTVVWLAVSDAAVKHPSGLFFQGEQKFFLFSSFLTHENVLPETMYKLCKKKYFLAVYLIPISHAPNTHGTCTLNGSSPSDMSQPFIFSAESQIVCKGLWDRGQSRAVFKFMQLTNNSFITADQS